ncbi:MAG TPA: hypothetical protein ENJ18_12860 [Nannocystis exedens]|nr:hypothetical protein [Nannocystis exedens]
MEGHLRRSYPALRACLRASGVESDELDAALRSTYERAFERGLPVARAVLHILARQPLTERSRVSFGEHSGPLARDLLARFVAELGPARRLLFVANELAGATVALLALEFGLDEGATQDELVDLRRRFADYAESRGVPPRLLLQAVVLSERLPRHRERELLQDIEARVAMRVLPGRKRHPLIWALVAAPALLLVLDVLIGMVNDPGGGALSSAIEGTREAEARAAKIASGAVKSEVETTPEAESLPEADKQKDDLSDMSDESTKIQDAKRRRAAARRRRRAVRDERAAVAKDRDPGRVIVELEMLKAAKGSLDSKPRKALAILEQHARDFPRSQLRVKRDVMRIRALCALGKADQARSLASSSKGSKVADELRRRCGAG